MPLYRLSFLLYLLREDFKFPGTLDVDFPLLFFHWKVGDVSKADVRPIMIRILLAEPPHSNRGNVISLLLD